MKNQRTTIILVIACVILGLQLRGLFTPSKPEDSKSNKKQIERIETRLQPIYKNTEYHEKISNSGKKELAALGDRFDDLNEAFEHFKRQKDTVMIWAYCDSIRTDYSTYRQTATETIKHLDSMMINYKYIVKSKDTIIQVQRSEIASLNKMNRKLKWQRNGSVLLNAILTGLVIIK